MGHTHYCLLQKKDLIFFPKKVGDIFPPLPPPEGEESINIHIFIFPCRNVDTKFFLNDRVFKVQKYY